MENTYMTISENITDEAMGANLIAKSVGVVVNGAVYCNEPYGYVTNIPKSGRCWGNNYFPEDDTNKAIIITLDNEGKKSAGELFNLTNIDSFKNLLRKNIFPDGQVTEERVNLVDSIIKKADSVTKIVSTMLSKGFRNKSIQYFDQLFMRQMYVPIAELFDKYVKANKSDFTIKENIVILDKVQDLVPYLKSNYLSKEKEIKLVFAPLAIDDPNYIIYDMDRPEEDDDDNTTSLEDYLGTGKINRFRFFVLISSILDEIGTIVRTGNESHIHFTKEDIEKVVKNIKKINAGNYKYTFTNDTYEFLVKNGFSISFNDLRAK